MYIQYNNNIIKKENIHILFKKESKENVSSLSFVFTEHSCTLNNVYTVSKLIG
jgi:hypothetical protein